MPTRGILGYGHREDNNTYNYKGRSRPGQVRGMGELGMETSRLFNIRNLSLARVDNYFRPGKPT
jgi:hypothetical protein